MLLVIQALRKRNLFTAVIYSVHRRVENGAIYFVQNDMTYKAYKDVEPEIVKARDEFGADQKIEGLIQGEKNKAIEMVKTMLEKNYTLEQIVEVSKFAIKEVRKIKKDMK